MLNRLHLLLVANIGGQPKAPKNRRPFCQLAQKRISQNRSVAIFILAIVSLTAVMGYGSYNQPQLRVNMIAPETIIAPSTKQIENKKKTAEKRIAASYNSVPVLMLDPIANEEIQRSIQKILDTGNTIRNLEGAFPFTDNLILSFERQRYLHLCSEAELQALFKVPTPSTLSAQNREFTTFIADIQSYRATTSAQNVSTLIATINQARQGYAKAKAKLLQIKSTDPKTVYDLNFLDWSDEDWEKVQTGIHDSVERILAQGIPPGLPRHILKDAVDLNLRFLPQEAQPTVSNLLLSVLSPNLKKDEEQTKLKGSIDAAAVKPYIVEIAQGDVIIQKQQRITEWQFQLLEEYHRNGRAIDWRGLGELAFAVAWAVGVLVLIERRLHSHLRQRDRLLVLLLTLSTPLILTMGTPYTNWSAVGILLSSFYGSTIGMTVIGLLMLLIPISVKISRIALLTGVAGGIMGSCMAGRLRSREELAILGVVIGLTEGIVYLVLTLLFGTANGLQWYHIFTEAGLFALSGLVWSIVALGSSPYLEQLFDLVTPIRLAELASPNRHLLKRLATETPGTFQHTLFVSTLAEAAAKQLGCNVELIRAGTLYHDIGKMHDPLAFIENQMGGPNKHDTEIKDPWKSAAIIKKHVTEGLVMARKHRLPTAIQAFIPEHQGSMQISYFYHQALEMAAKDSDIIVNEADFRYDGPIPQSRETGILMLADSCEAALRSLKDACPEQALKMLNNILRARWQDNQLIDSGLTREEMSRIAEIFVQVWQQFHHKRIAYPKLTK
jgi:cyclic-di-AMP phosphodiesterase PgpH